MRVTCLSAPLRLSPFVLVCMTVTMIVTMIVVRAGFLVRMGMPGLFVMVRVVAMMLVMPGMHLDVHLGRRKAAADDAFGPKSYLIAAGELPEVGGDLLDRAAGVHQAAEDHVAGRAGEAVEKHDAVSHGVARPFSSG